MEIRDEQLVLRPIRRRDTDALVLALNDPDIVRFIPGVPSPYTRADAKAWVKRCNQVRRSGESCPFAIVDAETGDLLGSIELHFAGPTVGYWVAREARGRGVATRALVLLCSWTDLRPLRLTTHPDNRASQRVAEKGGFRRIGTMADHPAFRDGTRTAALYELA
ncbi:MAG TPA: GNAT family N-acetyltransferase [Gaiellaceae bacterium]|nr:GNAT family N-acetyltransferase [Gaiellaceae bacterium]